MGKFKCPPKTKRTLNCSTDSVAVCGLSVDDTTHQLIKTDVNRVVATLPSGSTHAQIGRLYSTIVNVNTSDQVTHQELFNNTSEQTMYLDKIVYSSIVDFPLDTPLNYAQIATITIIKNVTILDPGEPLTPTNLNTAFPNASSLSVGRNPNSLSGTAIFGIRPLGGFVSFDFDGRIVVPPNTNLVIQYFIQGPPQNLFVSLWSTIIWYEL